MTNVLAYTKAIAALIGSIATALTAIYSPDTQVGTILVIVLAVVTGIATFALPNAPAVATGGEHRAEGL